MMEECIYENKLKELMSVSSRRRPLKMFSKKAVRKNSGKIVKITCKLAKGLQPSREDLFKIND